jgi:hypothetical protein
VTKPFLLSTQTKSVTARALQNASQIAILVEWADPTQDESAVGIQDFRDAVAVAFPQAAGQPYFCMGQVGGNVNLWHWKADWQAELTARKEMEGRYPNMYVDDYPFTQPKEGKLAGIADYSDPNYLPAQKAGNLLAAASLKSPVEDLVAGGFGSLTSQPLAEQNVQGSGKWQAGRWQVIFSRSLASTEKDDVSFQPGKTYSMAFAVWDGANQERNGQKSTSQWVNFQLATSPQAPAVPTAAAAQGFFTPLNLAYIWFGFLAVLVVIGAIIYFRLPK